MDLEYNLIFSAIADLIIKAIPIAVFFYLLDISINFFFSLAFPKHFGRRD